MPIIFYGKEYTNDLTDNNNKDNMITNFKLVTCRGSMEK